MSVQDEMPAESNAGQNQEWACRPAAAADIPALAGLLAELMLHMGVTPPECQRSAATLDAAIRSEAQAYLLASDPGGNPVGMCGLLLWRDPWTAGGACELRDLVVTAGFRRRGVGRALLQAAVGLARQRGCTRLYLLTDVWGEGGPAVYRDLGFKEKPALYFEKAL